MIIKQLYALPDANTCLLEAPDGKLYTFRAIPARKLTDSDLAPVTSPLAAPMYIAYAHAEPFSGALETLQMNAFGLSKHILAELRRERSLTQAQLAERSGINVTRISKIERGEIKLSNISLATAAALARALDIEIEKLIN